MSAMRMLVSDDEDDPHVVLDLDTPSPPGSPAVSQIEHSEVDQYSSPSWLPLTPPPSSPSQHAFHRSDLHFEDSDVDSDQDWLMDDASDEEGEIVASSVLEWQLGTTDDDELDEDEPAWLIMEGSNDETMLSSLRLSSTHEVTASSVDDRDPPLVDQAPLTLPRSPTQEEIDSFFGYKPPQSSGPVPTIITRPTSRPTDDSDSDYEQSPSLALAEGSAEPSPRRSKRPRHAPRAFDGTARELPFLLQNPLPGRIEGRPSIVPAHLDPVRLPLSTTETATFLLEPINASLVGDEKRLAIIDSLARLVAGVSSLLSTSDPLSSSTSDRHSRVKTIRVVLAKKGSLQKRSKVVSPRTIRGNSGPACGEKALATFVKVVEYVLDGLLRRVMSTKRDLYYRAVGLFGKQKIVDDIIENLAATLLVSRSDLFIISSPKGVVSGPITLALSDSTTLPGSLSQTGTLIPSSDQIISIGYASPHQGHGSNGIQWVLIVEKEAVFMSLSLPSLLLHPTLGPGILITGKGYPDIATRQLLRRLSLELPDAPILALVDADPHGIEILSTYANGSKAHEYEKEELVVNRIEYIGLRPSEVDGLGVSRSELLGLCTNDRKRIVGMLRRRGTKEEWKSELAHLLHRGYKAEIEVITSSSELGKNKLFEYVVDRIGRSLERNRG